MTSLLWPVKGDYPITQTWEQHKQRAISNGWCWKPGALPECKVYYYPGIDIGCPKGTPVYSSIAGMCEVAKENTGYGWSVKISNSPNKIVYGHLSSIIVDDGQYIESGLIIAYSGGIPGEPGAGNTTGAHLHWEYRVNNVPADPGNFIRYSESDQPITNPGNDLPEPAVLAIGDTAVVTAPAGLYTHITPDIDPASRDVILPYDTQVTVKDVQGDMILVKELWVYAGYLRKA